MVEEGKCGGHLLQEERAALLVIARDAIDRYLKDGVIFAQVPGFLKLTEPGAAFVTLTEEGRLRGCIGYTEAVAPLYRTVQECAVAAATEDPRFRPVFPEEMGKLRIEISVLTPPVPILPEDVRTGIHGLVVRMGARRGLLLPQVATEYGWDRETFLAHTCRKAGLPEDAWRKGAELSAFTAEVFGEGKDPA